MTNEEFIASISLENETWKEIPSWEGYYAASNLGRIVSLGRHVNGRYSIIFRKPKIMTQTRIKQTGYLCVILSRNNDRGKIYLVHRLIALAFIPNPLNYTCVDHIDTDRTNNNVSNLRWCTYQGNMKNQETQKRLHSTPKPHKRDGLSYQVVALKDDDCYKIYPSISSVKEDNHDPKSVWLACNGRRIQHHGFKWMYLEGYEESIVNQ